MAGMVIFTTDEHTRIQARGVVSCLQILLSRHSISHRLLLSSLSRQRSRGLTLLATTNLRTLFYLLPTTDHNVVRNLPTFSTICQMGPQMKGTGESI